MTEAVEREAMEYDVVVVGAGPAGLAYATIASGRGHKVTLFDAANEIGGQFNLARKIPVRAASGRIVAVAGVSRDLNTAGNHPRISRLAKSLEHLRENFSSPVSIAKLAKDAGITCTADEVLITSGSLPMARTFDHVAAVL